MTDVVSPKLRRRVSCRRCHDHTAVILPTTADTGGDYFPAMDAIVAVNSPLTDLECHMNRGAALTCGQRHSIVRFVAERQHCDRRHLRRCCVPRRFDGKHADAKADAEADAAARCRLVIAISQRNGI